ncbi:porin [Paracidovorax konjaci]|uniref:Outer membrane protein (Porin) n=1 Tax=Paracidovorax konjaci TaxID=32040 RepID=A0A1I1VNH6_9BURK|nr:porin [Paracidovorax konjaci]SFD84365.1 Outer membrane protein (porin) [Paracidovorax konjaci]
MRISFVKKTIACAALATVSPLLLAQSAGTSSVQLYGIVDMAYRHTNNEGPAGNAGGSLNQMVGGGMSQSRWGINVNEDLGGGTKALVNLENRFGADTGTPASPYFQQSWVGLQGGFGRVTLGRQYNILFDLVTSTYASYPYSPYMDVYKPEIGFALGARADNMIKYMAEIGPWRGGLQYSFDEKSPTGGKTAGGYVRYAAGGLAAGLGYQNYEFASGKKIDAWTVGGSYRMGDWYFNAGYGQNKVDDGLTAVDRAVLSAMWQGGINGGFGGPAFLAANKRTIYKVGAGYQITPQINLGAHYFRAEQKGTVAAAEAKADFYTMALDYAFSKRTDAYIEIDHTKLKGDQVSLNNSAGQANGAKSRTGYTIGLRHRF